ncbi:hypothetical protein VPH35_001059 [Triticum aestivum]
MRSQPRSVLSPAPATLARLLAASSATCELRTALPAPSLVLFELEPPPPPPPLLLAAPSVLDLDLQRTPPPHALKVSVAPPELLLEGALLPVASPCSVVTAIAVGEEPSLPSALALARSGSQSSKEVLGPDAVVRASRPPLAVSWVSLADEVCSIDDEEELTPLTPLAARCSSGVSDPAAAVVVATTLEASSDLGWVKVGGRRRSASPALALAPRPIPAWLHGRCCRCLVRGHCVAVCRDPF